MSNLDPVLAGAEPIKDQLQALFDPRVPGPSRVNRGARAAARLHRCIRSDTFPLVNTILRTAAFDRWLTRLRDPTGKARIVERIRSAERGQFGDCKPVGQSVSEMRIHVGPGYRVYFTRTGSVVYVLLCGGGKSTQRRDIAKAVALAERLRTK